MSNERREFLMRTLEALRAPSEGLLPTATYASLLEAFMTTREASGEGFTEDEFYAVVEWADLATLRSQWLEGLVAGTLGVDLVDGNPVLCAAPPPAALRQAVALALVGEAGDLALVAALRVFVAGRHASGAAISDDDLAIMRAWCASAAADRALLDLALGYPSLGLDLTPDGRVVLIGAGSPP